MMINFDEAVHDFTLSLKTINSEFAENSLPDQSIVNVLSKAIRESCKDCRIIEQNTSNDISKLKVKFRASIKPWFSQSWFMDRALNKPCGYPGDYEMLEAIYENSPKSNGGIGAVLDMYFLQTDLARAVRGRKNWICDKLHNFLSSYSGTPSILDIACGPCREIKELMSNNGNTNFSFCGLDYDDAAISFAKEELLQCGVWSNSLKFRKQNVLRLVSGTNNVESFGTYDLIYSVGLYDYLPNKTLKRILTGTSKMLRPSGQYIIAFKDSERYDKTEYQWHVDWYFYQRTKFQCEKLINSSGLKIVDFDRDESGVILFFITQRN